jgi:hypothetical protein
VPGQEVKRIVEELGAPSVAAVGKGPERRRFRRYAVHFRCLVKPKLRSKQARVEIASETKDVSKGGLYFASSADWKIGTAVECVIELPLQLFEGRKVAIRCTGKVVRQVHEAGGQIGVGTTIDNFRFIQLQEGQG